MPEAWREVWRRRPDRPGVTTLGRLLALDGFEGMGAMSEEAHRAHLDRLAARLGIAPGDSVFDVGCGAGAFLYPWYERGHRVGGLDYAPNLVEVARAVMPEARIEVGEARDLGAEPRYDLVASHGVFFYFPDLEYAAAVLGRMVRKARRAVAVLDVPDLARRDLAQALRRRALGTEEYDRRSAGLDHLYFERRWFSEVLGGRGLSPVIEDVAVEGYLHSAYRYDVLVQPTPARAAASGLQ